MGNFKANMVEEKYKKYLFLLPGTKCHHNDNAKKRTKKENDDAKYRGGWSRRRCHHHTVKGELAWLEF